MTTSKKTRRNELEQEQERNMGIKEEKKNEIDLSFDHKP